MIKDRGAEIMTIRLLTSLFLTLALLLPPAAWGAIHPCPDDLIGGTRSRSVRPGESLVEIARAYDLGFNEIAAANPGLDPFIPPVGAELLIPTGWVLPERPAGEGIVVNLSEMRLYHFTNGRGGPRVATFPVGIGSEGSDTPLGNFRVVAKQEDPPWHVPVSIRRERPELPAVVPAGPDNPLGSHALRLSGEDILIHGTNRPWGVGRRVSHGCIRLYPEDIPRLYRRVPVGTGVTIVRQPVKVGVRWGWIYLEVHPDPLAGRDCLEEAVRLLGKRGLLGKVNRERILRAVREQQGVPVNITE